MNLSYLNDEQLDQKIGSLIQSERELLTEILHHLREAERRRLYSKYKYRSLFDYTVQRFGYSEDQGFREGVLASAKSCNASGCAGKKRVSVFCK